MEGLLKTAIENLATNPKKLMLIDSIGAFISATLLFIILSFFKEEFGLPKNILYLLFGMACLFFIYSICCFYLVDKRWRIFLSIIAVVNLLYCLLTAILLIIYFNSVTTLGYIYFVLEILIIYCLAYIEIKIVNKKA